MGLIAPVCMILPAVFSLYYKEAGCGITPADFSEASAVRRHYNVITVLFMP